MPVLLKEKGGSHLFCCKVSLATPTHSLTLSWAMQCLQRWVDKEKKCKDQGSDEVHSYKWAYSKLNALGRRYLPPIICAFHNQEQVVSSLPFTAGVSEVDLPPIPGHCKIIYKRQLLAFYQCFGWHKSFRFTWLQKEEKKKRTHNLATPKCISLHFV